MRNVIRMSSCLLSLAFCLFVSCPVSSAPIQRAGMFEGVEIKLSLGPTEIISGQPVTLQIALTNTATEGRIPVFSARLQLPESNDIDVFVQAQGEAEYRLDGAFEPGLYSGNAIDVPPGRTITHELPLIYDKGGTNGYIFGKPGTYLVRAQLRFSLSSNPEPRILALPAGRIVVRAPEGASAEAWKELNDAASAKALQLGRVTEDNLRKKFSQVAEKYVETPYGKLCARTVAISTAYTAKPDLKQALDVLKKYEKAYREESDTDLVVYTIAAAYHMLQQPDLSRDWLFYLVDKFPKSSLVRKQDPLVRYYLLDPAEATGSFPWYLTEKPWVIPGAKPPTSLQPIQD